MPAVALPAGRSRTGAFERLRGLPERRVVDRLLRGRLCIWVIGVMLGGIVAMQVSLLRLNAGISRAVISAQTLERQNSDLQESISKRLSGDRVRAAALADGMLDPQAGDTKFVTARPGLDAALAVERMTPPSETAQEVMANGGRLPGVAAAGAATSVAATPLPATTAAVVPTPTPAATPIPTATPVPTAPGTGAATAPQG